MTALQDLLFRNLQAIPRLLQFQHLTSRFRKVFLQRSEVREKSDIKTVFKLNQRPRRTPFYSLQQSLNRRPNKNKKESAQNLLYRSMFINPRYFQPAHIPQNCFRRAAKLLFSSELFLSCSVAEWL